MESYKLQNSQTFWRKISAIPLGVKLLQAGRQVVKINQSLNQSHRENIA